MNAVPSQPCAIRVGFELETMSIPIESIAALKTLPPATKGTKKYMQIAASIRTIGLVEPLAVTRDPRRAGKFFLLDGLLRMEALKDLGQLQAECLISTDDEAYTYNKRINRLTAVQEHRMIMRAVARGVSEERLAEVLNLEVTTIRRKFRMLDGICDEAATALADTTCPTVVFELLKQMRPLRQVEAAELMIGQNNFTSTFAKALLAATPVDQRLEKESSKGDRDVSREKIARLDRELATLQVRMKSVEDTYSIDNLHLTIAKTYLTRLLEKRPVVRWLEQRHPEYLAEFRSISTLGAL